MRAVHWQDHGSLGFKSTSALVCDMSGDTVDDFVPVISGSSVSSLVEYVDD